MDKHEHHARNDFDLTLENQQNPFTPFTLVEHLHPASLWTRNDLERNLWIELL